VNCVFFFSTEVCLFFDEAKLVSSKIRLCMRDDASRIRRCTRDDAWRIRLCTRDDASRIRRRRKVPIFLTKQSDAYLKNQALANFCLLNL
jgi:hypothetical protein